MADPSPTRNGARAAGAALSFLTAVPLGRRVAFDERDLRRGAVLFPAVGALVGVVVATVAWGAHILLLAFPAGILGVAGGGPRPPPPPPHRPGGGAGGVRAAPPGPDPPAGPGRPPPP